MTGRDDVPTDVFRGKPVLNVIPLKTIPYNPPPVNDRSSPFPAGNGSKLEEKIMGPFSLYFPSDIADIEWKNVLESAKNGVFLSGSAALGKVGSVIGLVDIGESEDSYLFRVSLPGVNRDQNMFQYILHPDGKIMINGRTTTGGNILCKNSLIFQMQSQNMPPSGQFTITFHLPGPVYLENCKCQFGIDGIFEGIVKKNLQGHDFT